MSGIIKVFLGALYAILILGMVSVPGASVAEEEVDDSDGWDVELGDAVLEAPERAFTAEKAGDFKAKGDWCSDHNVPESMCTICSPKLIPQFKETRDWCGGHGVPESLCSLCNSSLAEAGLGLSPPEGYELPGALTAEDIAAHKAEGDWCVEHSVPESLCVLCDPGLIPSFKEMHDWCREHALPESLCPLCNPSVAALGIGRDWCEEHGLPESQCVFCHPELAVGSASSATGSGLAQLDLYNLPEISLLFPAVLPVAGEGDDPDRRLAINPNCRLHGTQILLASPEVADAVGIQARKASVEVASESLSCYGEVQYNQNRFVRLSARTSGIVESVDLDLGDAVSAGQVVATIDSVELSEAKADFLRARATHDRWKWVHDSYEKSTGGGISKKERIEARSELERAAIEIDIAAQRLKNLGLDEEAVKRVETERDTSSLLPISAPFDSMVVEVNAVPGQVIDRGGSFFALADTSTMWVMLDVFVRDLAKVERGRSVTFFPEGMEGQVFQGTIDWISADLDEKSKTAKARAVLENPDGLLRAGLFGKGEVVLRDNEPALTVHRDSVQWDGCCNIVFVQQNSQLYQPRKVRIGHATDEGYVIKSGLMPGERVVTTGAYLLKTEILKGSIGAGCTCGG